MAIQTLTECEILPINVVPTYYRLSPTPPFKYVGKVDVTLGVTRSTSSIILNALEPELLSASIMMGRKSIACTNISIDEKKQTATIDLDEELEISKNSMILHIGFLDILNDKMSGFCHSSYIDAKYDKKWLATTQMGANLYLV